MKKKSAVVTLVLLIAGIGLMLFAGYRLIRTFMDYHSSNQLYDQMEESYVQEATEAEDEEAEVPWYELASVDLEGLQQENSDVIGWIYFENENISYPILYSGDDSTYLRTAMNGTAATAGSIFMEGANTPDFEDSHTIIYGHNMRNLSMFGKLKYYKEQDDYYEDHMYFQIMKEGVVYRYQIFAYADVPADSFVYEVPFSPNADFASFLADIYKASYIDSGVLATKDDKVITLSTCSSGDNRFVVHAVRVDSHEIGE
jgi:sortase B